eukprot:6181374-Pleurochrysis_carterae.AAC.1
MVTVFYHFTLQRFYKAYPARAWRAEGICGARPHWSLVLAFPGILRLIEDIRTDQNRLSAHPGTHTQHVRPSLREWGRRLGVRRFLGADPPLLDHMWVPWPSTGRGERTDTDATP